MRDDNFNFLRYYAAIGVLVGHTSNHMGIAAFGYDPEDQLLPFYHLGVPFFFLITGFFIYSSYKRTIDRNEAFSSFMFNRILRTAPSIYFYVVVAIVVLLLIGAINFSYFLEPTFYAWVASHIFLIPVYHPSIFEHIGIGVLNGSLWTIPAQITFYLILPLIFLIEKKHGFRNMIVTIFLAAVIFKVGSWYFQSYQEEPLWVKFYEITFMPQFLFFALGIFWARTWSKAPKSIYIFFLSLIMIFVLKSDMFNIYLILGDLTDLLWALPFSYAAIWFGYKGFKFFRIFGKFEDLGMGIYIWHMLIVNIFLYIGLKEIDIFNTPLMHITVIIVTIIMSYASRILIEKPALKFKKNKVKEPKNIVEIQ